MLSSFALPQHLAVIMDGNGRWAAQRGLPRTEGHKAGVQAAKQTVTTCRELGIAHLSMYTFSTENWGRPKEEIGFLFELLVDFLGKELPNLLEQSIRLHVLGEWDDLPMTVRQTLKHACRKTRDCSAMVLNLALNYSGRHELLRACRRLLADGVSPDQLTAEDIEARLYTAGQPDPDMIIRTSNEQRLSNFLLYQCAYSELYFTPTLWPDFDRAELDKALQEYSRRQRRYGLTGEQLAP